MFTNLNPIVYSLLFPRGDASWHNQLVHNPERATLVRNHVTLSQYYNYKLSIRQFFSSLFYGKNCFSNMLLMRMLKLKASALFSSEITKTN